jgi:hypothetical protein
MADFLPPDDPVIKAAWIETAPPQAVAGWLSQMHPRSGFQQSSAPDGALQKLLARRDGFIDLAIALYGDDPPVLRELWKRGDNALRRAILTNQNRDRNFGCDGMLDFLGKGEELLAFFKVASEGDIWTLVTNQTLGGRALEAIFARQRVFADLPVDQWRTIAVWALQNPNLHRPTEKGPYADPDSSAREQAMSLLLELPVEAKWAGGFESGLAKFKDLNIPIEAPKGIFEGSMRKFTEWKYGATREFLETIFERWTPDEVASEGAEEKEFYHPFRDLRMSIAALVPNYDDELRRWVESYPDKWVQIGSAKTKCFRAPDEFQEWFDRHGWDLLMNVEGNRFLHLRNNAVVVEKVRSIVQFAGEERAERDGVDLENMEFTRSQWMHAADRFHEEEPNHYFAWDDDIDGQQNEGPPSNPVGDHLNEILSQVSVVKETLNALSQTVIAMERRSAELIQVINEAIANTQKGMRRLENLAGWTFVVVAVVLLVQLIYHY